MKLLIAGSRTIPVTLEAYGRMARFIRTSGYHSLVDAQYLSDLTDRPETNEELMSRPDVVTEVVSGTAIGADKLGEEWAVNEGLTATRFPADWRNYGKRAGIVRNQEMGEYADAAVVLRVNGSSGSTHMINYMRSLGKPVYVMDIESEGTGPDRVTVWSANSLRPGDRAG